MPKRSWYEIQNIQEENEMTITREQWKIDRIKGKYKLSFDELSKDLHDVINQYKIDGTVANLNRLKLKLINIMNMHKNRMCDIGGKDNGE